VTEGAEAIAKSGGKEEGARGPQCLAIVSSGDDNGESIPPRDLVRAIYWLGEPLPRGDGAYQVEIMRSVPGNLALPPSFHSGRLGSTCSIYLFCIREQSRAVPTARHRLHSDRTRGRFVARARARARETCRAYQRNISARGRREMASLAMSNLGMAPPNVQPSRAKCQGSAINVHRMAR